MKKLAFATIALLLAAGLFGCGRETKEELSELSAEIKKAVLTVPTVTDVRMSVSRANELASLSITVRVISSAQTKEELLTVLEDVAHAVLESTRDVERAKLTISVENGTDIVRDTDLDPRIYSLKGLREYFGQ